MATWFKASFIVQGWDRGFEPYSQTTCVFLCCGVLVEFLQQLPCKKSYQVLAKYSRTVHWVSGLRGFCAVCQSQLHQLLTKVDGSKLLKIMKTISS
jgi:hypothetical protein